jgi:hypothetical protein
MGGGAAEDTNCCDDDKDCRRSHGQEKVKSGPPFHSLRRLLPSFPQLLAAPLPLKPDTR